jgi:medium-chain acyl-[acyl-carrier-protein] hydrolase
MNYQPRFPFSPRTNQWIDTNRRNPGAQCRLFCLPYAGGSAMIYRDWHSSLPEFVEVLPLQLPGRGRRIKETPLRNIGEIARLMVEDLLPVFREKPFALFGHSMGATISYEVALRLRYVHKLRPMALIASGRQAPHVIDRDPPSSSLPHDEFIARLHRLNGTRKEVLESAELMEFMIPLLRADFEAIETYVYRPGPKLDCPIAAFGGVQDPDILEPDVEEWSQHTSGEFRMKMFAGGHFFLHEQQAELLSEVAREMVY